MNDLPEITVLVGVTLFLLIYILYILFCLSLYSTMKHIPKDKHSFPAWFCWLFLIPFAGYVFQWIMLPFGIPNTLKRYFPKNEEAQERAKSLFSVGLAQVILKLFFIIPLVRFFAIIAHLILLIIYWIKIVEFKKRFLLNKES